MAVETPDCREGGFFEDSVLRVNYVPLFKDKSASSEAAQAPVEEKSTKVNDWEENTSGESTEKSGNIFKDNTDYFGYEDQNQNAKRFNRKPQSPTNGSDNGSSSQESNDSVMAFIAKLQERAGALDFSKCVEKGVKPGPLLGKLKNGIDVTLPDGSIVKADEVRGPASPGSVFIFVDIPDESYLSALTASTAFKPHMQSATKEDDVALIVVHFSPEEMMDNPVYKSWMDEFSPSTKHWFVNERNEFTGFFASHRIQRQLNELDDKVFPMLKERHPYLPEKSEFCVDYEENPAKKFKLDVVNQDDVPADPAEDKFKDFPELGIMSAFHVRPPKGFDRNLEPYSNPEKVVEDSLMNPQLIELIESFKEQSRKLIGTRSKAVRDKEFPKIITFGTGSCIPNKTRNVSANLVHISEDNCLIMDCGEGTLGQLIRFYGRDGADEVLKSLRMIYISHLHADHHLGLINILNRRRKLTNSKIALLVPIQMSAWLAFYNHKIEEIYSTFDVYSCSDLVSFDSNDVLSFQSHIE